MNRSSGQKAEQADTTAFQNRVFEVVRQIPDQKVATYGQIARILNSPGSSRAIGNALHHNPDPDAMPCFRVVNREGRLAENFGSGGAEGQKRRMEADGIEVQTRQTKEGQITYFVDLKKYGW